MSDPSYMIYCQKEYDVFYHTVMTTTNTNTNTEENQPTKEHSQLIKLYDLDVYRTLFCNMIPICAGHYVSNIRLMFALMKKLPDYMEIFYESVLKG